MKKPPAKKSSKNNQPPPKNRQESSASPKGPVSGADYQKFFQPGGMAPQ